MTPGSVGQKQLGKRNQSKCLNGGFQVEFEAGQPEDVRDCGSSETMRGKFTGQNLLLDADDTLWENNIYFERAIAAFLEELDHTPHSRHDIREHLNHCEHHNIQRMGYGLRSFEASLVQCFEEMAHVPLTPALRVRIASFAHNIASQEMELIHGVVETLEYLAPRHRLLLVTKGVAEEQRDKLERSGLAAYFSAAEVLAEKSPAAYRELVERHALAPASTWMIGNSPKSDIHAALSAGLNAVHVPHPMTWVLEECEICAPAAGRQVLEVPTFAALSEMF